MSDITTWIHLGLNEEKIENYDNIRSTRVLSKKKTIVPQSWDHVSDNRKFAFYKKDGTHKSGAILESFLFNTA